MTPEQYTVLALRTAADRPQTMKLIEAAMGIGGEGGEIVDILKKVTFYNKDLDLKHIKEEIGDLLWYVNLMIHAVESSWSEVFEMNIAKLEARYPDLRFDAKHAINRDVDAEQDAMKAGAIR